MTTTTTNDIKWADWVSFAKDVLGFDDEDVDFLKTKRIKSLRFFMNNEDLSQLQRLNLPPSGLLIALENFQKYILGHQPTEKELLRLSYEEYNDISIRDINQKYEEYLRTLSTSVTPTSSAPPLQSILKRRSLPIDVESVTKTNANVYTRTDSTLKKKTFLWKGRCFVVFVILILSSFFNLLVFRDAGCAIASNKEAARGKAKEKNNSHDDGNEEILELDTRKKVFIWPHGLKPDVIGEVRQILRDGVDRSTLLRQTGNIDEEDVIYAIDFHRSNCDSIVALLQDTLERRRAQRNRTTTVVGIQKVVLFDFRDGSQRDSWQCLERLSKLLGGEDRVEYACRQFWEGRNVSFANKKWDEPIGFLGRPFNFSRWDKYGSNDVTAYSRDHSVHLFRYPVRSDMVEAMDVILNGTKDRISLPRPIDAVSFSRVMDKTRPSLTLRGHVSELLVNMTDWHHSNNNLTLKVGHHGFQDEMGRSSPQDHYMKTMLASKIIVTAQRDNHEDHYRFFEAMLSGALVMTDPMHPLPLGYSHGKNVIVYTSLKDLHDHILYYIQHPDERLKIARAGYELAMEKHRTWNNVERILLPFKER